MKKLLLLTGVSAISMVAMASLPEPVSISDIRVVSVSSNGNYAVSMGAYGGLKILNLSSWNENSDPAEYYYETDTPGHGKCVSDNGIVVGISEEGLPEYWKDGEWNILDIPEEVVSSNLATAITSDGRRICGSLGMAPIALDGDALMQVPCVWTADGEGYGMPTLLPHPDKDFSGRVPQYVTANDISADGKTIVGQVVDAVGMVRYPIIYKEDENGEWSYELVHSELINPTGVVIPEFPGDGPQMPVQEEFMTPAELQAYQEAYQAYIDSMYQLPYPSYEEFMTEKEIEEYQAAMEEFNKLNEVWMAEYERWAIAYEEIANNTPGFIFNSIMISPDGKSYGCTAEILDMDNPSPWGWGFAVQYHTWVFDVNSDVITKYEGEDMNLTYMCNDGIALGATSVGTASNSFVLKNGEVIPMIDWMQSQNPEYAAWMDENMMFAYETYNFETDEFEYKEELMTGRAVATPDLSTMILSVENMWDYMDDGETFIFDMKAGTGVEYVRPEAQEMTIFDLSGRKLNKVSAPGIYIVNGEKKVVR